MAEIARRTFGALKTELVRRMARTNDSTFTASNGPAEQLITAAYLDICALYAHPELQVVDTSVAMVAGTPSVTAPTNMFVSPVAVYLREPDDDLVGPLEYISAQALLSRASLAAEADPDGQPAQYTRFGSSLYFDRSPDVAYKLDIFYQKRPTAPDFSSGSPEIGREWDEHIVELACVLAGSGYWSEEIAGAQGQLFSRWVQLTPVPLVAGVPQHGTGDDPADSRPRGGALG